MYYNLYNNKLSLIDTIHIKNAQVEGSIMYNNNFFCTVHSEIDKCGYIYIGIVSDKTITIIKKVPCNNFPHGIDIYNNKLVYSSYTNNSITIHSLDEFINI